MTVRRPRPSYSVIAAADRALSRAGTGIYQLGTGDIDTPLGWPSDCVGFAFNWCYGVRRHRPGFNRGAWASVSDDINSNSALEDAEHERDLFEPCEMPELGALLAYPTIRLPDHAQAWIGHMAIVTGTNRAENFDPAHPDWSLLDIAQCVGPNGNKPAIVKSTGHGFDRHDAMWNKPEWRTRMLRVVP